MSKIIFFEQDAREKLKEGVDMIADSVSPTLGPRGRNVVIGSQFGAPRITNDGRTIADNIILEDPTENIGAEIAKSCARKTDLVVGDATTTTIVLLQAIIDEGVKHLKTSVSPMKLRAGIEKATEMVIKKLEEMTIPVDTDKMMEHVATLSVENPKIGKIIADTIKKIGTDGIVTVEEYEGDDIEVEITEGMRFDRGCISFYMLTNYEKMIAEYRNVHILVTDKKIITSQEIIPFLEKLANSGKNELVIIADDVDGEARQTFELNKKNGLFNILAIRAPGTFDTKHELLEDIAVKCGATLVTDQSGINLSTAGLDILGYAGKVTATKDFTTIVRGAGNAMDVDKYVDTLKKRRNQAVSKYEKTKLEERIAQLSGSVAVIKVGGLTETDRKYTKDKIDDAVNATKHASQEGIVAGGGVALVKAGRKVATELKSNIDPEILIGINILLLAITKPLQQIARNAGRVAWNKISDHINTDNDLSGYDAFTDELTDNMIESGIIDPVKSVKTALLNASKDGALLLTTDVSISEKPEKNKTE